MRKPTHADAELMLHLYEIRREPEMRRARQWFISEFRPGGWDEIKSRWLGYSDEDRYMRMTVSYWEMVGSLVNRGVLHPEMFFESTGEAIVTWERCKPWIAEAREAIRPTYLMHFERMVQDHLAYRVKEAAAFERGQVAGRGAGGARRRAGAARARKPARARSRRR